MTDLKILNRGQNKKTFTYDFSNIFYLHIKLFIKIVKDKLIIIPLYFHILKRGPYHQKKQKRINFKRDACFLAIHIAKHFYRIKQLFDN